PAFGAHEGLHARPATISGRQPPLPQPKRQLLRLHPNCKVRRQQETREQQRVDIAARRLQPGLCQRVMEDVGLRAVGVTAEQTFTVDQTESCERGMGSKPMLEHDDLVGLETGRHDRAEHILIAEVERIGEPPVSVPGSVNVDLANALVPQLKQLMAERIGNAELPCSQLPLATSVRASK